MSLIICSNQSSDATSVAREQSIFKPYSFRNDLSSTLKLPKNCQVALESVKYSLDGNIAINSDSYVLYMYFGETLNTRQGDTMDNSTAYPIRIPLLANRKGVSEISFEDLTLEIETQLNKYIYHPNLRDSVSCEIRRNSSNQLEGIKIDVDEFATLTNLVPSNASEFGNSYFLEAGQDAGWQYEEGTFTLTETATNTAFEPVAILTDAPISLGGGKLVVNFSSTQVDQIDWRVGLSRYTNPYNPGRTGLTYDQDGMFAPMYFSTTQGFQEGPVPGATEGGFFADFCVSRNGSTLVLSHTAVKSSSSAGGDQIQWLDVVYGDNDIAYPYNISDNVGAFEKVEFQCKGEKIRVRMLDADDNACILYEYNASSEPESTLKAINQSCWTMYPVLSLEHDAAGPGSTLDVETYHPCTNISNPNILDIDNSWYQSQYRSSYGNSAAQEIETRPWMDEDQDKATFHEQVGINASLIIDLPLRIITRPSSHYTPSFQANCAELLGFTTSVRQFGHIASPVGRRQVQSTAVPRLMSAETMFVRLENFTTNSTNAHQGNRSKIIAHLPRFDGQVQTGRIFHQPAERVYLDLNNSDELRINTFDISFCYTNEQYATNLVGQSIVVLHFRSKDS